MSHAQGHQALGFDAADQELGADGLGPYRREEAIVAGPFIQRLLPGVDRCPGGSPLRFHNPPCRRGAAPRSVGGWKSLVAGARGRTTKTKSRFPALSAQETPTQGHH